MKIRAGFVSNSSSSSFICDICGETAEGMDMGLEEAGMVGCAGGHTFCEEHMGKDFDECLTKETVIEHLSANTYSDYSKVIEEVKAMNDEYFEDWCCEEGYEYIDELRYEVPAGVCPICNLTAITDGMAVDYLVKKTGFTRADMFVIIKEENKRRKKLYPVEYLNYMEEHKGILRTETLKEVKESFATYDEFYGYVYG